MQLNVNECAWMTGKSQLPCTHTLCYLFVMLEKRGNIKKPKLFSLPVETERTAADFDGQSVVKLQSSHGTLIVKGP